MPILFALVAAVVAAVGVGVFLVSRDPLTYATADVGLTSVGGVRGAGPPEKYNLQGEDPLPWCARFCRFCFAQAGRPLPGNPFLIPSVTNLEAALAGAGFLLPASAEPQRGDLILLRGIGAGDPDRISAGDRHVGIVESVTDSKIVSIDGDFGEPDGVRRVTRNRHAPNISGFGRIPLV